jgi:hypothetical protein
MSGQGAVAIRRGYPPHICKMAAFSPDLAALRASKRREAFSGFPKPLELPNEANFSGCWRIWSGLRDNVLGTKVCHFVTWLRFAKNGFVWGVPDTKEGLWDEVEPRLRPSARPQFI